MNAFAKLLAGLRAASIPFLILLSLITWSAIACAQENFISPPATLQWPLLEPGPAANADFAVRTLRELVENAGNVVICKKLMKDAGEKVPDNFNITLCPAKFLAQIKARQGSIRWAAGAKPKECGTKCMGRIFMTRTQSLDRPNTLFAMLYGHLEFDVDVKNTFTRGVRFGYEAQFHCLAREERGGDMTIRMVFDRPVVEGSGPLEGLVNFLLPVHLSDAITSGIQRLVGTGGSSEPTAFDHCNSIGVNKAGPPSADLVLFNRPTRNTGGPSTQPITSSLKKTATVHFLKVTRKQEIQFGFTPPEKSGGFRVFLNGVQAFFPDAGIDSLPATGGSAAIDLCKTIDMDKADRLQVIFVNTHGGAVWSQFRRNSKFGAGRHKMTTARTIVVSSPPGPPDPITGKSTFVKPHPIMLREFELLYTIEYHAPADEVSPSPTVTSGGTTHPLDGPPGVLTTSGDGHPIRPCRKI